MGLNAKIGKETTKLRQYQFPSRGNQAEDYNLVVNGETLDKERVRTTGGGGKAYTYIKMKDQIGTNQSWWLPGALASGTAVTIEEVADPAPKPPKAAATPAATAPAATPAAPATPAKPAAQRPAAKPKAVVKK